MSEQLTKDRIDRAMERIFFAGRDPRSQEYMAGCRAALEWSADGIPYAIGTTQADAWEAGWDEGQALRKHAHLFAEVTQ